MRNSGFTGFLIGLMLLLDFYVFQAIKMVMLNATPDAKMLITILYWTVSVAALAGIALLPRLRVEKWPSWIRTYLFATVVGLFFSKLIASLFFVIDDIRRGGTWLFSHAGFGAASDLSRATDPASRSVFLSWMGLAVGGGLFAALVAGFANKYRYRINRVKLSFENLPQAFKGLKMVHISDIHSGSFTNKEAVEAGVQKILKEKPDLILFTGDLVNDRADEMIEYIPVFSKLKATLGVYSTLGNHDYGDYVHWESHDAKRANLDKLKQVHSDMGWRLLMNEHVVLEKEGEKIALLGIENWSSKARFPKYGKMELAYEGTEHYPFKILMSHDPSHWDAEVRVKYPDVDLMLAGHTHGMQFGFELPGFRWSPVQYVYRQWAGLYEKDNQKLYINRGYGFIGYPGRVGILPEITVIELG